MIVSTKPFSVVLYSDRARILRRGRVDAQAGRTTLEVQGLPRGLDVASVRVSLRGKARLLSFDIASVNFTVPASRDAREIQAALEDSKDRLGILGRAIVHEAEKLARASQLARESRMFARGIAGGRFDLARQKELFAYADEVQAASSKEIARLEAEKRSLEKEIARLGKDLAGAGGTSLSRLDARIDASIESDGPVEVELVYVTREARWQPVYDLRFGESLSLLYQAQAAQQTGEAWNNVMVELSTAAISDAEYIPEFASWYVAPLVPVPPPAPQVRAAAPGMAGAGMEPVPVAASAMIDELELGGFDEASINTGAVVSYTLPSPADLNGNGEVKKLTISSADFPFTLDYVLAPAFSNAAYRRGEFENTSQLLLLAGDAQVFYSDDLVGKTQMEETPPSQKRQVFLGVESRLQVKKDLKKHEADKKLLGDDRRLRWEYRIEIENLLEGEVRGIVRDQIPVSRSEQIKVKLEAPDRPEHKDMGTLEWPFVLAKGAKRTIEYALIVEHPRAMQVTGLP